MPPCLDAWRAVGPGRACLPAWSAVSWVSLPLCIPAWRAVCFWAPMCKCVFPPGVRSLGCYRAFPLGERFVVGDTVPSRLVCGLLGATVPSRLANGFSWMPPCLAEGWGLLSATVQRLVAGATVPSRLECGLLNATVPSRLASGLFRMPPCRTVASETDRAFPLGVRSLGCRRAWRAVGSGCQYVFPPWSAASWVLPWLPGVRLVLGATVPSRLATR